MPFLIFSTLGPLELIIILAIVVVLFGASRIAGIGGAIGGAIREFRHEVKEPGDGKPKLEEKKKETARSVETEDRPSFRH